MKLLLTVLLFVSLSAFSQDSEKPQGKCVGSEALGIDGRLKNEEFCSAYEDDMESCVKQQGRCEFHMTPKKCVAVDRENEKHMLGCSSTWTDGECAKKSECKWGYPLKSCNAKDQSSNIDRDLCEGYDDNRSSCRSQTKCVWSAL
ncbi:MAG: hypothetical protein ACLGG7_13735 [Bacteriovoracia bacterium]